MTTYVDFVPVPRSAFQFNPVLGGYARLVTVTWNVFRGGDAPLQGDRGWYVNVYDTQNNNTRVLTSPLIGSDDPMPIAALAWDGVRQLVTVTTLAPHGIPIGAVADMTLSGATPTAYNGLWRFVAASSTTLTYPMLADPGTATVLGAVGRDIDLLLGYYASTMVYRVSSRRFEINP